MKFLQSTAIQTAFVAIASRLVGSTFRVADTFNPKLKDRQIANDPHVVMKREGITLVLAWMFALATNLGIAPLAKKKNWNLLWMAFVTSIVGTFTAESFARLIAYRAPSQPKPVLPLAGGTAQPLISPPPNRPLTLPPPVNYYTAPIGSSTMFINRLA